MPVLAQRLLQGNKVVDEHDVARADNRRAIRSSAWLTSLRKGR